MLNKLYDNFLSLVEILQSPYSDLIIKKEAKNSFFSNLSSYTHETNFVEAYRTIRIIEIEVGVIIKNENGGNDSFIELAHYVKVELEVIELLIKHPHLLNDRKLLADFPVLKWTDSKVALVELIYSLPQSMNGGHCKIKELAKCFQFFFQIDLGNYHDILQDINARKTGRTRFLDSLKINLGKVLDKLNSK